MFKVIKFILLSFFCCISFISQARIAQFQDANIKYLNHSRDIYIKSDGATLEKNIVELEVLNENGRDVLQNYELYYSPESEQINLIDAYSITESNKYLLDQLRIEDKGYISGANGFDSTNRLRITFPDVKVGSKITILYERKQKSAELSSHFNRVIDYSSGYFQKGNLKIVSEIELYSKLNDPNKDFIFKTYQAGNKWYIEATIKRPMFYDVINERNFLRDYDKAPWISVSTIQEWSKLGNIIYDQYYEKQEKQKLIKEFAEIVRIASQEKNAIDKINSVTSNLNIIMQYMGDWRTVNGRFSPQDFSDIKKNLTGDCKDFSLITSLILKDLGFDANLAIVHRGFYHNESDILPSMGAFNHAIVKAVDRDNKVYWVDPTNYVSMAKGIFPDIAGRKALVLGKNSKIEYIPNNNPAHMKITIDSEFDIKQDRTIIQSSKMSFMGESAISFTGVNQLYSKETIEDFILKNYAKLVPKQDRLKFDFPLLNSRIVKNIDFSFKIIRRGLVGNSNIGRFLKLEVNIINDIIDVVGDEVGDLKINGPFLIEVNKKINNISPLYIEKLNAEIYTEYFSIKRECVQKNNDLLIKESYQVNSKLIPNEYLVSKEFAVVKNDLIQKFSNIVLLI